MQNLLNLTYILFRTNNLRRDLGQVNLNRPQGTTQTLVTLRKKVKLKLFGGGFPQVESLTSFTPLDLTVITSIPLIFKCSEQNQFKLDFFF